MTKVGNLFYLIRQVAARLTCPSVTTQGSYGRRAISRELYIYTWIKCLALGALLADGNSDPGCSESVTLSPVVDPPLCVFCAASVRRG